MKYRRLGKTDLMVSEIGFGGWGIGGKDWGETDDKVSLATLNAAYDHGITFYDTAPNYGRSEKLIAEAFKGRRDKVIICTKTVDMEIGESLRHFGYIDVLLTHHRTYINDEIVKRMEGFVREGLIRTWGISAPKPVDARQAVPVAEVNLSMMDTRAIGCGLFHLDVGLIARTPLHFGYLTGLIDHATVFPVGDHRWSWPLEMRHDWIKRAKECLGDTPPGSASVRKALDWVLQHKAVSTAIVGMMTPEHVMDNVGEGVMT